MDTRFDSLQNNTSTIRKDSQNLRMLHRRRMQKNMQKPFSDKQNKTIAFRYVKRAYLVISRIRQSLPAATSKEDGYNQIGSRYIGSGKWNNNWNNNFNN